MLICWLIFFKSTTYEWFFFLYNVLLLNKHELLSGSQCAKHKTLIKEAWNWISIHQHQCPPIPTVQCTQETFVTHPMSLKIFDLIRYIRSLYKFGFILRIHLSFLSMYKTKVHVIDCNPPFQWTSERNLHQWQKNGRLETALESAAAEMQWALQRHSRDPTHHRNR